MKLLIGFEMKKLNIKLIYLHKKYERMCVKQHRHPIQEKQRLLPLIPAKRKEKERQEKVFLKFYSISLNKYFSFRNIAPAITSG